MKPPRYTSKSRKVSPVAKTLHTYNLKTFKPIQANEITTFEDLETVPRCERCGADLEGLFTTCTHCEAEHER